MESADAGGVSAGWSFEDGWLPSYPETSGYIVETFIAAARTLERPNLVARAHRIIDWELSIQHPDGAFPGHFGEPGSEPVVFNTGQIMHGMLAGHLQLGRAECLESAVRAGHWLARHQDDDGCWRRFEHHGVPHTYNTRGTWALLATAMIAGDAQLKKAAIRNLEWALAQQRPSGWFANNAFTPDREPFTHTIAYAIRGISRMRHIARRRALSGCCGQGRTRRGRKYSAPMAGLRGPTPRRLDCRRPLLLSYRRRADESQLDSPCPGRAGATELRENARRGIAFVKGHQRIDDPDPIVRGAIAGSAPIWGRYSMFEFPNWAPKFFADALMMDLANVAIPTMVPELVTPAAGGSRRMSSLSVMILCGRSPRHFTWPTGFAKTRVRWRSSRKRAAS